MVKYDKFTDSNLQGQKNNLNVAIAEDKSKLTAIESDIEKLEKAITSMNKHIEILEESHGEITDIEIDESQWKGQEKDKYEDEKSAYTTEVKGVINKTTQIRESLETTLSEYESQALTVEGRIANLNRVLIGVEGEIKNRENGGN